VHGWLQCSKLAGEDKLTLKGKSNRDSLCYGGKRNDEASGVLAVTSRLPPPQYARSYEPEFLPPLSHCELVFSSVKPSLFFTLLKRFSLV